MSRLAISLAVALLAVPSAAQAGMPRASVLLTEPARQRVEVISFFLVVLLVSAVVIRWLWNGLAKDFPRLPRLSYRRALGVVVLWGAVFVLVLEMISGARELMTPGAWKPNGVTYKLADGTLAEPPPAGVTEDDRRRKLDDLRAALWAYARAHGGELPAGPDDTALPAEAWRTPHPSGMRYLYVPGRRPDVLSRAVVAYEPELFGEHRLALTADGEIRRVTTPELQDLLRK
jgi:hypothetical protein